MRFGANLLLFADTVTPSVLRRFARIRDLGFDGVEVPVFEPESIDTDKIRRHAEKHGLGITTSGALPGGSCLCGPDARPRKRAEDYMRKTIRVAAALGANVLCGPLYKPVGETGGKLSLPAQRRETLKALRPLAQQAEEAGVVLALEPLNRFETDFMNTVAQGTDFCRRLKSPACGLLLDTFHMHVEEKSTGDAIDQAADGQCFAHFHASENDRGTAGTGQVHWKEAAAAVRRARYDSWVVLESFNQTNQAIRTAVSCWRPFYTSPWEFLEQGLQFVQGTFGRRKR
jgi:D-psicose/D-tagatose/L-ribulose 3-epimerase